MLGNRHHDRDDGDGDHDNVEHQCHRGREPGVPRSRRRLAIATTIDIQKIQRQPMVEATKPPKSERRPDPPHEPIDQKLSARCRSLPSKQAFIKASVAVSV